MKKLLIACSMVCAVALAVCAEDSTPAVTGTPKTTPWPWFTASATATNGVTLNADGESTISVVDGESETKLFEIDSELEHPVTFTPTDSLTQSMAKVSFKLSASFVPEDSLVVPTSPAKIGFAIHQTNETDNVDAEAQNVFKAWVGGNEWIRLTGATVPTENALYDLSVEIDNRDNKKLVRFSVGDPATTLTNNAGDAWIQYTTDAVTNSVVINFVGAGKVETVGGNQLQFIAEVVPISGKGTVEVKAEDKAAFAKTLEDKGTTYKSVDEFIAAPASEAFIDTSFQNDLAVGEAYAIGLVKKDSDGKMVPVNDGKIEVKAVAQSTTTDGIKLNLNIAPPPTTETGATIKYQLQGSKTGSESDYVNIGEAITELDNIKIPTANVGGEGETKYRYFKVKTIVTLEGAPANP